ncbi:MAG: hypothetical protein SLAVMIC_00086 [uncultured marine phage]|uniref:Uncharacterized protein n=1 Tax=uncultured marine phage TaxID=707152 RepID=A0A8D9FQG2_9VIRU|nr:MAG: hypothetical protein SLAVMIC_00086 [uncultured marine phage]
MLQEVSKCDYCGASEIAGSSQPTPGFYAYETIYGCGRVIHTWFLEDDDGDLNGKTDKLDKKQCGVLLKIEEREEKLKKLLDNE